MPYVSAVFCCVSPTCPSLLSTQADIRCNESYNNLLKNIVDLSPHINLPLLSARVNTKKLMGLGTRGISHRWSTLKTRADLLEEMLSHYGAGLTVVGEEDRWTDHASDATLPDRDTTKTKYAESMRAIQITPQLKWSSVFELILGREFPKPSASTGMVIQDEAIHPSDATMELQSGCELYFVAANRYNK